MHLRLCAARVTSLDLVAHRCATAMKGTPAMQPMQPMQEALRQLHSLQPVSGRHPEAAFQRAKSCRACQDSIKNGLHAKLHHRSEPPSTLESSGSLLPADE